MKVELNEIELNYLQKLIELEQANNLNDDSKNANNVMVANLVKKLAIPIVSNPLPSKSKFIDLLIENLEHGGRDEGIYFSDTLRYDSTKEQIEEFEKMVEDYKRQ